jgi:hypothetical protein
MKLHTIAFSLLVAAVSVLAADKQYIVSFPSGTSESEVTTARDSLTAKGCKITHNYSKRSPALSHRGA